MEESSSRPGRPLPSEHAPYYSSYIALVPDGDVVETLRGQIGETTALLLSQPESAGGRRYAEGKWSVREVVGHLADAERVFSYRALRFARADETNLPGFNENAFAARSNADARTLASLCDELTAIRAATVSLFASLDGEAWERLGTANSAVMSVRALAWVCAGHELHHRAILRERYL